MSWRVFLCLALVAMLCRLGVPPGYMPDLAAAKDGRLVLTLCSVDGVKTIVVDGVGQPLSSPGPASADCPYGPVGSAVALAGSYVPPLLSSARVLVVRWPLAPPVWVTRATGPPVGSRAPPQRFV